MTCIISPYRPTSAGYGQICINGKMFLHHRVAYAQHHGVSLESIAGKVIRHTCDNPPCINPEHLLLGTQSENMQDCVARGRHARYGCKGESHPNARLTEEDVSTIRSLLATMTCAAIARAYNVDRTTISKIKRGKLWNNEGK